MRKAFMNLAMILGLFPAFMSMVAVYFILKAVGLTEGSGLRIALILIYSAGSGVGFYIAKGFFDTVPKSLSEAAILDGCNQFQVFYKIILPLSKPIVVYTILTAFLAPWLDFVFVRVIVGPKDKYWTITSPVQYAGERVCKRMVYKMGCSRSYCVYSDLYSLRIYAEILCRWSDRRCKGLMMKDRKPVVV